MKKLYLLLALFMLFSITVYANEPSDWAKDEVQTATDTGFVPSGLDEDWQADISRKDFTRLAVHFLANNLGYEYDEFEEYVKFGTRDEMIDIGVLHEAGTYYFEADLEKGENKLIDFNEGE